MYFVPLFVILLAYSCILSKISRKTKETKADQTAEEHVSGRMRLRRSDMSKIERARNRTLRMTIIIVLAFIWCWTPYAVMTLWYMFDRPSAEKVDRRLQDFLFIMAVSNSCMNPLVYGSYAMNCRRPWKILFCFVKSPSREHSRIKRVATNHVSNRSTLVPKCLITLVKVGGSATKSTPVSAGRLARRLQSPCELRDLRPNTRTEPLNHFLAPSLELPVGRGGRKYGKRVRVEGTGILKECQSDPSEHSVYLVDSNGQLFGVLQAEHSV